MNASDHMKDGGVSKTDHAVLYGAGFFETFRTRDGIPVRLQAHLERLRAACARLGVTLPPGSPAHSAAEEKWTPVIRRMLADADLCDGVFRFTVTAGIPSAEGYGAPGEFLTVRPPPPEAPFSGIGLHILDTRRDTGEWRPRPKSNNYLNSLLAARELAPRRAHPADEGLMLDAAGNLSEGVFTNLIWIRDGVFFTPHEDTGCLPGIGRAHLIAKLREAGIGIREVTAPLEALISADAVATVSCVRGIVPVARLSGPDSGVLREWSDHAPLAPARARLEG